MRPKCGHASPSRSVATTAAFSGSPARPPAAREEGHRVDGLALRKLWMLAEVGRISWGGSFDIERDRGGRFHATSRRARGARVAPGGAGALDLGQGHVGREP